ncbi:MAG: hypothetical protein NTV43_13825 [Methylococcales bacterium]|nr:hypothetical protein [Methylococcales bacterium]
MYPFIELIDDREFLEEHLVYLKAILNNNGESTFGKLPTMGDIRRMLSGWRKSNRAIYQNPWVTFIRETLTVWRWLKKSGLKASGCHLSPCDSQGDVSLDYGHIIGFGFDWEESVVEDILDDMAQVGENPEGIIRLNTLVFSEVGERLCLLAKSRGLIRVELITFLWPFNYSRGKLLPQLIEVDGFFQGSISLAGFSHAVGEQFGQFHNVFLRKIGAVQLEFCHVF